MRISLTFILVIICVVLAVVGAVPGDLRAEGAGDGWRRTAHGWEQVGSPTPHADYFFTNHPQTAADSRGTSFRLDSHPAVLVVFQLLAAGFAFLVFPRQSQLTGAARTFPVGDQPRWHSPALIF